MTSTAQKTLALGLLFPGLVISGTWLGASAAGTIGAQVGAGLGFLFALMAAFLWR